MNLASLSGSIYINATLNCLIEIIGYVVIPCLFINRFGRIKTMFLILTIMLVCTTSGLLVNYFKFGPDGIIRWIGALGVCGLFVSVNTHTAECFPTNLRGQGLSIPDGLSRLTAVVTPFFGILYEQNVLVYWLIHVLVIFMAMVALFFLPETNLIYPNTKEECRKQVSMWDVWTGKVVEEGGKTVKIVLE